MIAKRRSIRTRLKEEHKKLVELQKSLNSKEIEIEDLFKQLNNINSSAEECNVYLTLLREDLLAKQKVIREMRKITVYVFSDGNIEMENLQGECPNFDASAEDCIRLFSKLTEKSKYEDLTLKQVKQFFQLKSLVDFLESQNLEFQISFESDIMKLLWEEEQE